MFEAVNSQFPTLKRRPAAANRRHWELCKSGCAFRRRGWIAPPLRTMRAGMQRRADVDFGKAARQFAFSTLHFATPTLPTSHARERYRVGLSANAIAVKQRRSISINHGSTECRD